MAKSLMENNRSARATVGVYEKPIFFRLIHNKL